MPLPASSTTLNGAIDAGSMNDRTFFTYSSSRLRDSRPPARPEGAGMRLLVTISAISPMPASPESGNASRRTSFTPLYSFGLCEAVICAPPSSSSCTTPKYSMSVAHMP